MTTKMPLCLYNGIVEELHGGDSIVGSTAVLDYVINVADYGAVPFTSGEVPTDCLDAFNDAITAASAEGACGHVYVPPGVYYIASGELIAKKNVTIKGHLPSWKPSYAQFGWDATYTLEKTNFSIIQLDTSSGAHIHLGDGGEGVNACLSNLVIMRYGASFSETDESLFAGTAIRGGYDANPDMTGVHLRELNIIGFNLAIDIKNCPRIIIDRVSGDNVNGIKIDGTWDMFTITDVHFWDFLTGNDAGNTHYRTGKAFDIENSDGGYMSRCFGLDYNTGIYVYGNTRGCSLSIDNCRFDGGSANATTAFEFQGYCYQMAISNCACYAYKIGLLNNTTTYLQNMQLIGCKFGGAGVSAGNITYKTTCGRTQLIGCFGYASYNHVLSDGANSSTSVIGCDFESYDTCYATADSGTNTIYASNPAS